MRLRGIVGSLSLLATALLAHPLSAKDGFLQFIVPSESMLPTLVEDTRFLATPIDAAAVERGDVVVYWMGKSKVFFVFRVIAFEGETFAMEDGVVMIDGEAAEYSQAETVTYTGLRTCMGKKTETGCTVETKRETLPGGASHRIIPAPPGKNRHDTIEPIVVPEGHFFVLGDNRGNASDSRIRGATPLGDLRYRAMHTVVSPLKGFFQEID